MTRRAAGSPSTATTRRWGRGRWRALSRSTSSARSPRSCCSAAWPAAATYACRYRRTVRRSRSPTNRRNCRPYRHKLSHTAGPEGNCGSCAGQWALSGSGKRNFPGAALAAAVDDAALGQIVRRHFHRDRISGEDADVVLAHLAGDVRGHDVAILQLHPESRVGQGLDDLTFHLDRVFFGHGALNGLRGANWSIKRAALAI